MSSAQRNFAAIIDLLNEHGVHVITTRHNHDYGRGDGFVRFTLSVDVRAHGASDLREEREHRLARAEPRESPEDAPRDENNDPVFEDE